MPNSPRSLDTPFPTLRIVTSRRPWLVVALLLFAGTALAGGPWQVLRSDDRSLVVRVTVPAPGWESVESATGARYRRPLLPGFPASGEPGDPALPTAATWIVVPDGTRPEVVPGAASWRDLAGEQLPPVPVPVRLPPTPDEPEGRVVERLLRRGETPARGTVLLPAGQWKRSGGQGGTAGLAVGTPVRWRDRWIAPLTCRPLAVDAAGRARRLLREGTWTIRFVPDKSRPAGGPVAAARHDARFAGLFLNGERLAVPPAVAPRAESRPARAKRRAVPLCPEVRLPVARTGLQRVTARQLQDAGLLPATGVREDQLRLYQRRYLEETGDYAEIEVPLLVEGDGGDFAGGDAIVFYGLRPRDDGPFSRDGTTYPDCGDTNETFNPVASDPVNGGNIYYLAVSEPPAGGWARMTSISLPPATGAGSATYLRSDYQEQDQFYDPSPMSVNVDRNHWNSRFATSVTVSLDPVSPADQAPPPVLRMGLVAFGSSRTYHLAVEGMFGTVDLGTHVVPVTGTQLDFTLTDLLATDLVGASLRIYQDTSLPLAGYLEWIRLDYPALYRAEDDRLAFHAGDGTGTVDLRVGGFGSGDLVLLDVSDPREPRVVALAADNVVAEADGTFTLSLAVAQDTPRGRRFLAYGRPLAEMLPAYPVYQASLVSGTDPLAADTPPDLIVVTHPDFRDLAEQWAAWRAAHTPGGLAVHVVDVHDLYDRFSGGLKNPVAIRRFCLAALDRWGSWALQLVGGTTENVRELHDSYDLHDKVPSYFQVWRFTSYQNEVLPADEWFVTPGAGADYPVDTGVPPAMLVGRFPVQEPAELQAILDKLAAFTAADDGAAWKRRGVFVADDAWGAAYDIAGTEQSYAFSEEQFETSEDAFATDWETFLGEEAPVPGLVADRQFLSAALEPLSPPHDQTRNRLQFIQYAEQEFLPGLLASLGQGALLVRYQGHANDHLLAHEQLFEDLDGIDTRHDVASLANEGRPFVFVGLGCHIGAYALGGSEGHLRVSRGLAEKLVLRPGAGACGAYASPGYEFLTPNVFLAEVQRQALLDNPPRGFPGGTADGATRWMLGEVLMAAEMSLLAANPASLYYRRAVAQYSLLGDPLLVLDAGPPQVVVSAAGDTLADGDDLFAADAANQVTLVVEAWDEAGIDRLVVAGSDGADYGDGITGGPAPGTATDQHHRYTVVLPVAPYDHDVTVHVYDTADVTDADTHFQLVLHVPVRAELLCDGVPFDPETDPLVPGVPRAFSGTVTAGAYLPPDAEVVLVGDNAVLSGVAVTRVDAHTLALSFTAEALGTGTPRLLLRIEGRETAFPLGREQAPATATVADLNAFPNPMRDGVRFLFTTSLAAGEGRIDVFSLAGRPVARIPVVLDGSTRVIVPWDGRDARGDRPANGVYLYRVTLRGSDGRRASSGMQRLVVMH